MESPLSGCTPEAETALCHASVVLSSLDIVSCTSFGPHPRLCTGHRLCPGHKCPAVQVDPRHVSRATTARVTQ